MRRGYIIKNKLFKVLVYTVAVFLSLWLLLPLYWTLTTSFSKFADIKMASIFPLAPTLENYASVLLGIPTSEAASITAGARTETIVPAMLSSLVVGLGVIGLTLLFATTAAYSFARLRFRGKSLSFIAVFVPRLIPVVVIALPFFILFYPMGLSNSHLGLILVDTILVLPLSVWILRDFFDGIPVDLEEAAMVDGANRFQAFYKIALPLLKPGLIAVATFAFMTSWGELFFAMILTDKLTLPPYLLGFRSMENIQFAEMAAGAFLSALPPLILAFIFQKYLTRGWVVGAVKR